MDYAAALIAETSAFADLLRDADPATPVPSCPGWTCKQLVRHVGRGDRWAAQIIEDRLNDYLDPREVRGGRPPDTAEGVTDWLNDGPQAVIDAVRSVGADTEVWTFLGPRPAGWWLRRRVHEVVVHRADAALALGREFVVGADVAADGIDEWLERVVVQAKEEALPLGVGQTLHLHAAEGGEWLLSREGTSLVCSHQHTRATVAIRGSAAALLLAATRRVPADDPQIAVYGDAQVWRVWLDRTPL